MSDSILRTKSKELAKNIVLLCKDLQASRAPSPLTNQLMRSGTSVGANIHEAQYAQGKADFISKLEIALKEASETEYWLELLFETGYLTEDTYKSVQQECGAIRRMLISSCRTVKDKGWPNRNL
ncbi:four helix bundle protein [Sporobacter termitidis DSM 10068]|uniref:Four helix bundle protein n=1 Tax=Sporobacter termitidis DSM 10068 TaxID=1123282 RepID=A0A1M5UHT9_9FIRM|nr:four helix bundle protein [Sporobacter termitidis]SHH62584.1 four helix bundle protein [Sporobacter termitidis DSM 10068]